MLSLGTDLPGYSSSQTKIILEIAQADNCCSCLLYCCMSCREMCRRHRPKLLAGNQQDKNHLSRSVDRGCSQKYKSCIVLEKHISDMARHRPHIVGVCCWRTWYQDMFQHTSGLTGIPMESCWLNKQCNYQLSGCKLCREDDRAHRLPPQELTSEDRYSRTSH